MTKFEVINDNLVIVAFIAFCFLWGLNAGNHFDFDIRLLIYLFIAYGFWSKNISLENKLFLFPFIITESIRDAGYFNGGFILILIIIVMLQFNLNKKK